MAHDVLCETSRVKLGVTHRAHLQFVRRAGRDSDVILPLPFPLCCGTLAFRRSRLVSLLLLLVAAGCATRPESALKRFEFSEPQMGVPFRIVLYAPDAATAESSARAAFQRVSQLNDILSDYDTDSELSRLSRTAGSGQAVPLSPELWKVLERAQQFSARSDGAFDVTVGPYVSLWRKARREQKLPRADLLAAARQSVGWQKLKLDPKTRSATLLAEDMRLDLGGIAKGYALDEALRVLRQQGVPRALVTGGGDMAAGEPPPGQRGWRIEVAPLDVTNAPPARFLSLANAGLATSGDLFQRLEIDGRRYSHVVDPRTGLGLTDHSLVTVIAPDAMTADGLSTAVSVLGPQKGFACVEETPRAAACVVRMPDKTIQTGESHRFGRYLESTRRKATAPAGGPAYDLP